MSADIASVDEEPLEADLRELVRKTVQETLNALLDEEADEMVGAERYERTAAREAYRSGHYKRKLVTVSVNIFFTIFTNVFSPIAPTRMRRIRQR